LVRLLHLSFFGCLAACGGGMVRSDEWHLWQYKSAQRWRGKRLKIMARAYKCAHTWSCFLKISCTFSALLHNKHDRVCVQVCRLRVFSQNFVCALLRQKNWPPKIVWNHNEAFLETLISCYPSMYIKKPSYPKLVKCLNCVGRVRTAWQRPYT
jgi:hypothetical protein